MPKPAEATRSSYVPQSLDEFRKFLENMHAAALSYKAGKTRNWDKNAEIFRGNNWDSKREGNPFFNTKLARAKLDKKAAKLTACKPIFGVLPRRSGLTETAKYVQRIIEAGWDAWGMQMRLEQLSMFAKPFGCGYFKTVWDPRAMQGLGDIVVAEIDPRAVAIDPYTMRAYDLERSLLIVHETTVPYSWVKQNFPKHYREVQDFSAPPPGQKDIEAEKGLRWTNRQIKSPEQYYLSGLRATGEPGSATPIPYVRIREFCLEDPRMEDDEPLYPNGRIIYVAGSGGKANILNPEPEASKNPFFDGMWPWDLWDNRGDIDSPYGSSEVENIGLLEESINRTGNQSMRWLIKNISIILADAGALTPELLKRLQDFGDVIISKMRGLDVKRERAENPITNNIAWINMVDHLMDQSIGMDAANPVKGQGRVEVRSPDLLYGLQASSDDIINKEARRLEAFLERVGQKCVSRVFQFYHRDRFIPYVTAAGAQNMEFEVDKLRDEIQTIAVQSVSSRMVAISDEERANKKGKNYDANVGLVRRALQQAIRGAWRQFEFKIVPLSSLAATRAARAKMIAEMIMGPVQLLPFRLLIEEAGYNNAEDLIKEAAKERQELLAAGLIQPPQPKGGGKKK